MVNPRNLEQRWLRRYKIFFIVGTLILSFQIYLALRFFTLNTEETSQALVNWSPHRQSGSDPNDIENSVNSARRSKDTLAVDDEDLARLKSQTATAKLRAKNNTYLRLEELDFVPPCAIVTKEAISAIHRAKTQKCKQLISNTTCLIKEGRFYPKRLPNYCPNGGREGGKSFGCFKDEKNYRLLNGYYGNYKSSNSPEYCVYLCLQSGFMYAGVQYSTECFCGNDEPPMSAKLPDSSCNMKCPADSHMVCGGYYTINIYQTGIAKFVAQTAETSVLPNVAPVRIAFLLTLNGRALRQVRRLIKVLYQRDHYYYIHVDVRQDYLFRELLPLEQQFPNIRLTRRRFSTIWGGASLLEMLLATMRELLETDWKWDFVINLSESDYPVKPLPRLVEFLTANKGRNFVKSHGREVQRFIQKQGLDKTFIECDNHMWRTGDRTLPFGIQIDGGSDWIALSRNFVAYASDPTPDELVRGLLVIFQHTLLPAESFFHTILKNSRFCDGYVDNNLHVTNWKRKLGCKCQYKHIVDWCGCSPNDFRPEDWLRIQNTESRNIFFARKFEPVVNQAVVLQLEQWLFGLDLGRVRNINSYWQSVYHHRDLMPLADDALLSVSHSVARLKGKAIKCSLDRVKILEVSSYHVNDLYHNTTILVSADVKSLGPVSVEIAMEPKNRLVFGKQSSLTSRLKTLAVSTEYDQKEQILRNFARIMGPYSDPTVVYEFNSTPDFSAKVMNVTFLWVDPAGRLVEVSELSIDDSYVIGHIKPALKQPLLPGIWSVKLIYNKLVSAHLGFLITPLQYFSRNVVAQNQVGFIHSGSDVVKEFDSRWDKFLPNVNDRDVLLNRCGANSKRFGPDLEEWIDSLVGRFFRVGEMCVAAANVSNVCGLSVTRCEETGWSTFAHDPKSFLGRLNETSGSFDF